MKDSRRTVYLSAEALELGTVRYVLIDHNLDDGLGCDRQEWRAGGWVVTATNVYLAECHSCQGRGCECCLGRGTYEVPL